MPLALGSELGHQLRPHGLEADFTRDRVARDQFEHVETHFLDFVVLVLYFIWLLSSATRSLGLGFLISKPTGSGLLSFPLVLFLLQELSVFFK